LFTSSTLTVCGSIIILVREIKSDYVVRLKVLDHAFHNLRKDVLGAPAGLEDLASGLPTQLEISRYLGTRPE